MHSDHANMGSQLREKNRKGLVYNFSLVILLFRDLLLNYLPPSLAQVFAGNGSYAFIVHPRDTDDHQRKYPFAKNLPRPIRYLWSWLQWPVIGSQITGLVTCSGRQEKGWIIICPMTAHQMIRNREVAKKRVLQSIRLAEKLGARIVGLGAFTSIVTNDGNWLLGKVHCGLTTGNAFSAAIAVQNVKELLGSIGKPLNTSTVAVVGAVGSEGSACSKLLAGKVGRLILIDKNRVGGENLLAELSELHTNSGTSFNFDTKINTIKEADAVIAVTNVPGAIVRAAHLKSGSIVVDAAQPKNVSRHIPHQRRDVLVVESAIVQTPGVCTNFDLGLEKTEALGCLAETQLLAWMEHQGDYSLGKADLEAAEEMLRIATKAGYKLARFRNSVALISSEDIERVKRFCREDHRDCAPAHEPPLHS